MIEREYPVVPKVAPVVVLTLAVWARVRGEVTTKWDKFRGK
jgi:hypothetical protein